MSTQKKDSKLVFLLAFLLPVLSLLLIFAVKGIYPFGDRSFLRTDMYHQYAPFHAQLAEKLQNGESLLYSWEIGAGSNFITLLAYYLCSPFNLLLFLINLFPSDSTAGAAGGGMPMLPGMGVPVDAEPSMFAVILERIASVLSAIILIVGSAVLLRYLVRALLYCMRRVLAHLKRYAAAVTEDYEDEITDTREESGQRTIHPLRRKAKPRFSYPDTPAGRIRRRYAQLLARHSTWAASSTARENLSAEAAALYERARYSEHVPTAEDAKRFEQETQ